MFDFTRLARGFGFVFLGYLVGFPVLAICTAILVGGFHLHGFDPVLVWWQWPLPCLFPVLSVILVVDFYRRLRGGQLSTSQVTGHRASAAFLALGACFAGPVGHWAPALASGGCFLLLLLTPTKKRATASTWQG